MLSNRDLTATLKKLANAHNKAFRYKTIIAEHCIEKYGVEPSDVDNDAFIDSVDAGCGICNGMTADEFHRSMVEAIAKAKGRA